MFQLQLEVDRLEELKMQNMKKVIEAIRVELAQYWDQCFYSQEQRQAFAPFYAGEYRSSGLHVACSLVFYKYSHSPGSISSTEQTEVPFKAIGHKLPFLYK